MARGEQTSMGFVKYVATSPTHLWLVRHFKWPKKVWSFLAMATTIIQLGAFLLMIGGIWVWFSCGGGGKSDGTQSAINDGVLAVCAQHNPAPRNRTQAPNTCLRQRLEQSRTNTERAVSSKPRKNRYRRVLPPFIDLSQKYGILWPKSTL